MSLTFQYYDVNAKIKDPPIGRDRAADEAI